MRIANPGINSVLNFLHHYNLIPLSNNKNKIPTKVHHPFEKLAISTID